jgi:hypothetical protein|tara:strand:+ start:439 stop:1233 length:795 start_codon:yes stop_codon:yes gene_type:complete
MRKYVGRETIHHPRGDFEMDVYENSNLTNLASYLVKYSSVMAELNQGKGLPKGARLSFVEGEFKTRIQSGKGSLYDSVTEHKGKENYTVVIDDRLSESEKIAKLSHEIGHLLGGHKVDERDAHKLAIGQLYNILRSYETLLDPDVRSRLKKKTGRDAVNPSEIPREQIKNGLQYLIDTRNSFGVSDADLKEIGIEFRRSQGLEGMVGLIIFSFGLATLLSFNITISGLVIGTKLTTFNSIGLISTIIGVAIISRGYIKKEAIIP